MNQNTRGNFIVLEGNEGSGKTTQTKMLVERLKLYGIKVLGTREPTDGPIGNMIRNIFLMANHQVKIPGPSMSMLFAADRYDHIMNNDHGLKYILEQGENIICDRYILSNIVYQSLPDFGTNRFWETMSFNLNLNNINLQLLRPDVTIYIDTNPEVSMDRVHSRGLSPSIYEDEYDKIVNIRKVYLDAIDYVQRTLKENIIIVDGNNDIQRVHDTIWSTVYPLLNQE